MSLKLKSFQFISADPSKWVSEKIQFAERFTVFLGDNGSGKTPMMRGIAYALGYPSEIPPPVRDRCSSVEVSISAGAEEIKILRNVSKEFLVNVTDVGTRESRTFESEREFSTWLLEKLGFSLPRLTSRKQAPATPYIAQLLPLFWVSQSKGWTYLYQPLNDQNFIKDQEEEVIRMFFDLAPKHPYDRSEAFDKKKKEYETVQGLIELKKAILDRVKRELGQFSKKDVGAVQREKSVLAQQLEATRGQLDTVRSASADLDASVDAQKRQCFSMQREVQDLAGKIKSLEIASAELDAETEVLESNEVATDEFRLFCGTDSCKLFETARQSYGKRLLYLKDQLKDIRSNSHALRERLKASEVQHLANLKRLEELESIKANELEQLGLKDVLDTIDSLGRSYSELDRGLLKLESLEEQQREFNLLLEERERLGEQVKDLRPTGGKRDKTKLYDAMEALRVSLGSWIKVLRTPNVDADRSITVGEDFSILVDGDKFTEDSFQDGSTRARIVLAYYAALFESATPPNGKHPGVLMLDTPRQQEINFDDLQAYFSKLALLAEKRKCQVVLACKDPIFQPGPGDAEFRPRYNSPEGLKYLGVVKE